MADVTALKRRSAAFLASGQADKARAVDAEIARLRGAAAPAPEAEVLAEREDPAPVEVSTADLGDVEVADATRRGPGRPRKQR